MHEFLWLFLFVNGVSTWELIPLTGAQQTQILNRHNVFRSNLARGLYKAKSGFTFAKATNMRKLVWNYTLVLEAATYAETCPPNAISSAGINVYIQPVAPGDPPNTIDLMVNKTVNTWANQFFTNGPKGYVTTAATAHATQMAWSTTQSIGCAYVLCGNFSGRRIVVCHYYPPGNVVGQRIYNQGATCSKCPTESPCLQASGLCVTPTSVVFPAAVQSSIISV
ncbi:unnamed protein product, partial [Mesorhabditis belari]|uniref:SCP domain-containing protein n=1 Tax=Mesorhabditis belari TaxID=2138241 RepID=A0AAF3FIJ9_9BILA